MSREQVTAIVLAVLGSNGLTAVVSSWQTRQRLAAESTQIISQTYDKLIEQLTRQLNDALNRIQLLEDHMLTAKETEQVLSNRVALLERRLIQAGVDLPYDV